MRRRLSGIIVALAVLLGGGLCSPAQAERYTMGQTANPTTTGQSTKNTIRGLAYCDAVGGDLVPAQDGNLDSAYAYLDITSAGSGETASVRIAVYSYHTLDNSYRIDTTAWRKIADDMADGWYGFEFSDKAAISTDSIYGIFALHTGTTLMSLTLKRTAAATDTICNYATTSFPATQGFNVSTGYNYSIYVTYTVGGGPAATSDRRKRFLMGRGQ